MVLAQNDASRETDGPLRKIIADLQRGAPDAGGMEPELGAAVQAQAAAIGASAQIARHAAAGRVASGGWWYGHLQGDIPERRRQLDDPDVAYRQNCRTVFQADPGCRSQWRRRRRRRPVSEHC